MKKLAIVFLIGFATAAFAQGVAYPGTPIALTRGGFPASGATITVCSGNVAVNLKASPPCSPYASIYSDLALTVPITQPGFKTDGLGNYPFFVAASSTYTIVITGSGLVGTSTVWNSPIVSRGAASDLSNGTTGSGAIALADSPTFTTQISTPKLAGITNTSVVANLHAANSDALGGATLDTDGTMAANSDAKVASQKAVVTYAATHGMGNASAVNSNTIIFGYDSPGAITVNANTCTERTVSISGVAGSDTESLGIGGAYTLEAGIAVSVGQVSTNSAKYRICNVTTGNITLGAGSTFLVNVIHWTGAPR